MLRVILFGVVIFHLWSLTTADCTDIYGCECLKMVKRDEWGARRPRFRLAIPMPVDMIFIYHTAMSACHNLLTCSAEMRRIQDLHMDTLGWDDISYSYLVGEDGSVYEGRGWNREGAHTKGFNRDAVSVAVMGDFTSRVPNEKALKAVQNLISCAFANDILTSDYRLYRHRDARNNAPPGNRFYQLVQSWPHYDFNKPAIRPFIG